MFPSSVAYIFVNLQRGAHSLPVACPRAVATHANRDVQTTGSFQSPYRCSLLTPGVHHKSRRSPLFRAEARTSFSRDMDEAIPGPSGPSFDDVRTPHPPFAYTVQDNPLLSNVESFPGEWSPSGRHARDLLEREWSLARGDQCQAQETRIIGTHKR
ncbi:hypothetical protein F5144DRAFT_166346 [Chaetomium tenue]|uniref:Uncharacterized protein n=1 Tax=Chaetomium tenue TaxID=1854479 RepID=A0ACB7PFG5_9PEZI|nr:hypothetical protein F5144DRAFT_166346 [Chaetomium globosum]